MKINQVEELTGVTKKNIRFYESEGLIEPKRNPANGYREYSLEDVAELNRIKLLRKLDVSCEMIRQLQNGTTTLERCMEDHLIRISHRQMDLVHVREICEMMAQDKTPFEKLNSEAYLEEMSKLEKGGTKFMDVKESDIKSRRNSAIVSAVASICFLLLVLGLVFWANLQDPAPVGILIFVIAVIGAVVLGILLALRQRLGEVKKGEIDEASKY